MFCNNKDEGTYIDYLYDENLTQTPYYEDKCMYDLYDGEQLFSPQNTTNIDMRPEQCWSNKTFISDYTPYGHGTTDNRSVCGECYTGSDCIRNNGVLNSNYCYIDEGYPGGNTLLYWFNKTGTTECQCLNHTSGGYNPPGCDSEGFCFGKENIGAYVDCPAECESENAIYVGGEYPYKCSPYYEVTISPKNQKIDDNITITYNVNVNYSFGYPPTFGCWYDTFTEEKWCYATSSSYCNPICSNYTHYVNASYNTSKNYELEGYTVITYTAGWTTYYDSDTSVDCWKTSTFFCGETCDDGILNRDETEIDYGGSCGTCFDNLKSTLIGETGVDYGGVCGTCFDNKINIVYGQSVFNETEPDYGGACGYCEDDVLKADDENWKLARVLQKKDERFDFNNCQNATQVTGGAAIIMIIILALAGLFIFIIILLLLVIFITSFTGVFGVALKKGLKFLWVKGKERWKRKKEDQREKILLKTIYNKELFEHFTIFLLMLSLIDLITTVWGYLTIENFYEVNKYMNFLISQHIMLFIIVKVVVTIMCFIMIWKGIERMFKKIAITFKNTIYLIFYELLIFFAVSFYIMIVWNNLTVLIR